MMVCRFDIPCIATGLQGKNRYRFAGASFRHEFIFQALTNLEHILKRSSSRWTVSRLDKSLRMSCVDAFGCWELPLYTCAKRDNLRLFEAQMQEETWLKAIKGLSQRQEWLHNLIPNLYLQQVLNLRMFPLQIRGIFKMIKPDCSPRLVNFFHASLRPRKILFDPPFSKWI